MRTGFNPLDFNEYEKNNYKFSINSKNFMNIRKRYTKLAIDVLLIKHCMLRFSISGTHMKIYDKLDETNLLPPKQVRYLQLN